jgi:hypothetical protein
MIDFDKTWLLAWVLLSGVPIFRQAPFIHWMSFK